MDYANQSTQSSFQEVHSKPQNNLVLAILGTIISCCSPYCIGIIVGIVAIIFASQVNSKYDAGDYIGAEKSAKNSKLLSYIAIGLGILGLLYTIYVVLSGGMDVFIEQYKEIIENAQNQ